MRMKPWAVACSVTTTFIMSMRNVASLIDSWLTNRNLNEVCEWARIGVDYCFTIKDLNFPRARPRQQDGKSGELASGAYRVVAAYQGYTDASAKFYSYSSYPLTSYCCCKSHNDILLADAALQLNCGGYLLWPTVVREGTILGRLLFHTILLKKSESN